MLVKLKVSRATFDDIRHRILDCGDPGQLDRFLSPREAGHPGPDGGINLSDVVIVIDPAQ